MVLRFVGGSLLFRLTLCVWTPKTKREVTICNLFVNHKLTVADIIRVLDEDHRHIVNVLLKGGIVSERRQQRHTPPKGIERRRAEH
jgi:hypothetical protein